MTELEEEEWNQISDEGITRKACLEVDCRQGVDVSPRPLHDISTVSLWSKERVHHRVFPPFLQASAS